MSKICCEVCNCIHNQERTCMANTIDVKSSHHDSASNCKQTQCNTFKSI